MKQSYLWGQVLQVFLHLLDKEDKRKSYIIKLNDALSRVNYMPKRDKCPVYFKTADIVEKAVIKTWDELPIDACVTISALCWLILNRHRDELRMYKLNRKHFEAMVGNGVAGYAMATAKVLNVLEKNIAEAMV